MQPTQHIPWRKSTYSGDDGGNCIEAAPNHLPTAVPVRDSKDPHGPTLLFTPQDWTDFLTALKSAQLP